MDPCPFVRVLVGNLALRVLGASKPARSGVHPSSSPCYCKIRLGGQPSRTAPVTLIPAGGASPDEQSLTLAAAFYLSRADVENLAGKSLFAGGARRPCLRVAVYKGRRGATCGVNSGKLLGRVTVPLDLKGAEPQPSVFHNGWVSMGKARRGKARSPAEVHLTVRADPDPRFVFEFGGEPERSPQVFQVQGSIRQPVFTCKFACRNPCERTRSLQMETGSSKSWLSSFGPERERLPKERKGWSVTVHDLSGSPVALASMVTPFVASPGTDRVSRSNPGAWLVLRPGDGTWKPWGRLEAWRERNGGGTGGSDGLGYRFELLPDAAMCGAAGVVLAEATLSASKGGKFTIDLTGNDSRGLLGSPGCSPRGSGDFGYGLYPFDSYRGFVTASTVKGEGKKQARPSVEVGVQQVRCTEDAAAFVALAAAIDLSMEACRLFSRKLKKELSQPQESP